MQSIIDNNDIWNPVVGETVVSKGAGHNWISWYMRKSLERSQVWETLVSESFFRVALQRVPRYSDVSPRNCVKKGIMQRDPTERYHLLQFRDSHGPFALHLHHLIHFVWRRQFKIFLFSSMWSKRSLKKANDGERRAWLRGIRWDSVSLKLACPWHRGTLAQPFSLFDSYTPKKRPNILYKLQWGSKQRPDASDRHQSRWRVTTSARWVRLRFQPFLSFQRNDEHYDCKRPEKREGRRQGNVESKKENVKHKV